MRFLKAMTNCSTKSHDLLAVATDGNFCFPAKACFQIPMSHLLVEQS